MQVLIIEDEQHAAARVKKFVSEIEPEAEFPDVLVSIDAAVDWFQKNDLPDLVIMDIHLSDGNCFEIFEQVSVDCPVIFATAYDEYALKAFAYHSIDYILKPLKKKDLQRALGKFQRFRLADKKPAISAQLTQEDSALGASRFLVKVGHRINLIKLEEIAYFYSKDKITFAITKENRRFPINKSLEMLEGELPSSEFFRINRKFIIHRDAIAKMSSHTKGRVKIKLDPDIDMESIVSTERSPHFKKWLLSS